MPRRDSRKAPSPRVKWAARHIAPAEDVPSLAEWRAGRAPNRLNQSWQQCGRVGYSAAATLLNHLLRGRSARPGSIRISALVSELGLLMMGRYLGLPLNVGAALAGVA